MIEIQIGEGDRIEWALKQFRRKMLRSGLFKDMKKKRFYEKPSEARKRKAADGKVHDYAFVGTMGAGTRIFDVTDPATIRRSLLAPALRRLSLVHLNLDTAQQRVIVAESDLPALNLVSNSGSYVSVWLLGFDASSAAISLPRIGGGRAFRA